MYVIKNLKSNKYYQKLPNRDFYDAELSEATRFDSEESALQKASILHAEVSMLGLGINFKVEEA